MVVALFFAAVILLGVWERRGLIKLKEDGGNISAIASKNKPVEFIEGSERNDAMDRRHSILRR